jgi:hypothetical protein
MAKAEARLEHGGVLGYWILRAQFEGGTSPEVGRILDTGGSGMAATSNGALGDLGLERG